MIFTSDPYDWNFNCYQVLQWPLSDHIESLGTIRIRRTHT